MPIVCYQVDIDLVNDRQARDLEAAGGEGKRAYKRIARARLRARMHKLFVMQIEREFRASRNKEDWRASDEARFQRWQQRRSGADKLQEHVARPPKQRKYNDNQKARKAAKSAAKRLARGKPVYDPKQDPVQNALFRQREDRRAARANLPSDTQPTEVAIQSEAGTSGESWKQWPQWSQGWQSNASWSRSSAAQEAHGRMTGNRWASDAPYEHAGMPITRAKARGQAAMAGYRAGNFHSDSAPRPGRHADENLPLAHDAPLL